MLSGRDLADARLRFREAVHAACGTADSSHDLVEGARALSLRYRSGGAGPHVRTADDARAYAVGRLPGTHAAMLHVLGRLAGVVPGFDPAEVCDVGAGPGAASWAAAAVFGGAHAFRLIDAEPSMLELGRRIAALAPYPSLRQASWTLGGAAAPPAADLVLASYVLGELDASSAAHAAEAWWASARSALVVVEPGTPQGFERIRALRAALIARGAHAAAPCPHDLDCPMASGDWCHFRQRVERSSVQRAAKQGYRGYEDEKFSYVALVREPVRERGPRVLRSSHGGGRVHLRLCEPSGAIADRTVGRSQGDAYRAARRADWGDELR